MSIMNTIKSVSGLVREIGYIELNKKMVHLHTEVTELVEENNKLKKQNKKYKRELNHEGEKNNLELEKLEQKKNQNERELLNRLEHEIKFYSDKHDEAWDVAQSDRALYLEGVVIGLKMAVEPLKEIYDLRNKNSK